MFAVVDVETTGGHPSGHGMTEIGVVVYDGVKVLNRYSTLLNPNQHIPLNIQVLTGINPDMVADAPSFKDVAEEIREVLADHIFVAHNVNFDIGFVSAAFEAVGINYNPKRLCTVRYARRIEKGLRSYSLSNLCKHFNVKNEAAHRALGDANATTDILEILLDKDSEGQWQYLIKKNKGEFYLPANLPSEEFKNLPQSPGVYYFKGEDGKPIYIGKASNLKKRVSSHFISDKSTKRSQAFKREIFHIDYELTGSELVASLLEDHEIRHYWPVYNRAQKKPKNKLAVFCYQNQKGVKILAINKLSRQQGFLKEFYAMHDAQAWVLRMIEKMNLNPVYCGYPFSDELGDISDIEHNEGVERLINHLKKNQTDMVIKTSGREEDEDGYVLLEAGKLSGIGFVSHHESYYELDDYKSSMRSLNNSSTSLGIINKALEQGKLPVISF